MQYDDERAQYAAEVESNLTDLPTTFAELYDFGINVIARYFENQEQVSG